MIKHNQVGAVSGLAVSLVLAILLFLGAAGFGAWAFSSRQDYKNNADAKISAAVTVAKRQQSVTDTAAFNQAAKKPLTTYVGPQAYGSVTIQYPKTWSAYIDTSGTGTNGSAPVNAYFNPDFVPSISATDSTFALRVEVLSQSYAQTVGSFTTAQQESERGETPLTIQAYALPKLPKVVGIEASGPLPNANGSTVGTAVVLPLRSETIEIWTDGTQYLNDFNTNILPNFSFSP